MRRLPKINKKTADPELLRTYKDARNERRSGLLWLALPIVTGICVLSVLGLVFLQPSPTAILAVCVVCLVLIIGFLLLMAGWSPSRTRKESLGLVLGFLAFCAFAAWFVGWLEGLIFT